MDGKEVLETAKIDPTTWVERYSDHLYKYALARVSQSDTAEDLVQETFLSALNSMESFQQQSSERTWLFAILRNKIVDYYRKTAARVDDKPIDSYYRTDLFDEGGHWTKGSLPHEWEAVDLDDHEFQKTMNGCLERLPEKHRSVFVMKIMEGISTEDLCKELTISTSNYWIIMHRARLQLRECMEKHWFDIN